MRTRILSILSIAAFVLFVISDGKAAAEDLSIESYDLIGKARITRTVSEFSYSLQATNSGPDYQNVRAIATSRSPHTMVVHGEVGFGDMAFGDTAVSQGAFTIRHDRRYPFSWSDNIAWEFTYDPVVGDSFRVGPEGGAFNNLKGTAIVVPPGALSEERLISVETYGAGASPFVPGPYLAGARFGPPGLTFSTPISVTFSLSEPAPAGAELALIRYDEDQSAWSITEFVATVNPGGQSASAEINHFSDYFVMELGVSVLVKNFQDRYFDSCNIQDVDGIYAAFRQQLLDTFPLNSARTWDFSAENATYGYNCYRVLGMYLSLRGQRIEFGANNSMAIVDAIEREETLGDTGQYFSFHIMDDEERQASSLKCGDFAFFYSLDLYVNWAPGAGVASLEADSYDDPFCIDKDARVRAKMTCGSDPYPNVGVTFRSKLGTVAPDQLVTDQNGMTPWAIYSPEDEGAEDLLAEFDALDNVAFGPNFTLSDPLSLDVDACPYIEISPSGIDLFVGSSETFTATLKRADNEVIPGQDFEWNASNPLISVAKSSSDSAVVTGVSPGDTKVIASATLEDDEVVTGSADIEVLPLDKRIEVSPSTACLVPGDSIRFEATVYDLDDEPQPEFLISWTSDNENVLSIDGVTGEAIALAPGDASIRVSALNLESAELVEFIGVTVGYLGMEPKVYTTGVHGGFQLRVTAYDTEEPDTPLLKAGPFIKVCEFDSCLLVDLPYADPDFFPAQVEPDNVLYSDPNASYRLFSWFSSNENVATVDEYGHVHGVAEGEAMISAVALPGSDVEQTSCAIVKVVDRPAVHSPVEFFGRVRSCQYDDLGQPMTGPILHPFDLGFGWTGPQETGGSNQFVLRTGLPVVILPASTNISLIDDPAQWFDPFPPAQEYLLPSGFKILVWSWDPTINEGCGGHRYAAFQHVGYRSIGGAESPVLWFYLFEDHFDTPPGWVLIDIPPEPCEDEACGVKASPGPVAPEPYSGWWEDYEWLWEYVVPEE